MEKELYQRFYEIEDRHWWFVARKAIVLGLLKRFLPAAKAPDIFDAGCGTGGMLKDLEKYGQLVGADASEEAVKFCRLRGFEIAQCSVLDIPFQAGSFDVVLGLDLIEHLDDDMGALRELYRVCRPGGLLVVTVPAFQFLWSHHDELNHHKRRYTRGQLRHRLTSASFQVLRSSYFNSYLFPCMLAGRMFGGGVGQEPGMELSLPHRAINRFLSGVFAAELPLLKRVDLPVGGSILAIARRV
jgi:SAM-dependent methyltransferase